MSATLSMMPRHVDTTHGLDLTLREMPGLNRFISIALISNDFSSITEVYAKKIK